MNENSRDVFTLAVGQAAFIPGERTGNLETIAGLAVRAAAAGAELLVLPELATSGYSAGEALRDLAEPAEGASFARLSEVARERAIGLCYGYPERDGETLYNSAALIGADGRLLANHRKTHLFGDYEAGVFGPGDCPVTLAQVGPLKVALLICYEVEFPELVRAAVLAGAELVVVPTATASYGPGSSFARMVVASRATENNIFIAYANHCGDDGSHSYMGGSLVAGPLTDLYAEAGAGPELLTARLGRTRLAEGAATVPYLRDRQPALYRALAGQGGEHDA